MGKGYVAGHPKNRSKRLYQKVVTNMTSVASIIFSIGFLAGLATGYLLA